MSDGEIHDMEESIQTIFKLSEFGVSIIIVGIGQGEFGNMHRLDGDQGLFDSRGYRCPRDIVQFLPFSQFNANPTLLASHVL